MKKKIIIFVICALIFSSLVSTICYVSIFNYQYTNGIKDNLKSYNNTIKTIIENNDQYYVLLDKLKESNPSIRITYIKDDGTVLYDSYKDNTLMDNHLSREEIKDALSNTTGYEIRHSDTTNLDMMYYATKTSDGCIIRSSFPIKSITQYIDKSIISIVGVIFLVVLCTAILAMKFLKIIIDPLKDLEKTAYRISTGQLDKRILIKSNDEIGKLGEALNYMADKLEVALDELKEKQERLEAILISMDSGVIAVDRDYNVLMINPYAMKMFGVTGKIIGKKLIDCVRDIDLYNIIDSEKQYVELTIINPEKKYLRINTADIIDSKKHTEHIGKVIVVQDITDLKNMEMMRTQFVANVSHELKTPLTSIKGFAETLQDVEDEKVRHKFINIINNEADRLSRIINDLLELSTLEKNEDKKIDDMLLEEFNPNTVINEAVDIMKITANKKNISISSKLNNKYNINGNEDKFKQAIIILIDNAIKYTENNGSVCIESYNECDDIVITVKDTGIGIPEKDLPRIYERFYRVDKARSRQKGGTGLGLSIFKHIMILFKADVDVISEIGKGTTFIMKFKRKY